jgi:hypothetical protein
MEVFNPDLAGRWQATAICHFVNNFDGSVYSK